MELGASARGESPLLHLPPLIPPRKNLSGILDPGLLKMKSYQNTKTTIGHRHFLVSLLLASCLPSRHSHKRLTLRVVEAQVWLLQHQHHQLRTHPISSPLAASVTHFPHLMVSNSLELAWTVLTSPVECIAHSFGSGESKPVAILNRVSDGDGNGSANIATLIQMLGSLPSKTNTVYPEIPRSVPNNAGNAKTLKDKIAGPTEADNVLLTLPKSPAK